MKYVAVSRTGNECDIIEAFVRHNGAIFDVLIIIDDNSTDGTASILQNLKQEGLPIVLLHAASVDWDQTEFVSEMMRMAFNDYGASWVAPLDADEFLELSDGGILSERLPPPSVKFLVELRWSNFAWHRGLIGKEGNPVDLLDRRMPPRTDSAKVIVPRSVIELDPQARLIAGNHGVVADGASVQRGYREDFGLCHYPIRSIEQFTSKTVINYLRHLAVPKGPAHAGFQYRTPLDLIKGNAGGLMAEMEKSSELYAHQKGGMSIGEPEVRPLDYRGGPLHYSDARVSASANVIHHAEALARRVAELEAAIAAPAAPER